MSVNKYIYLDNNASTPVAREVVDVMVPMFLEKYANPSSLHAFGVSVAEEMQAARKTIASSINCEMDEIVFTASGSEGDNLCIKGYCEANKSKGKHLIVSCVEHPAILNAAKHMQQEWGYEVTLLQVDEKGFVSVEDLKQSIRNDTVLVSVMHANNEIGSIQPIEEIARICEEKGIAMHMDAVQSYMKVPIDMKKLPVTMASFSGHKIHAPKGIGFVFIRRGVRVTGQIDGGSQEAKLRAGTENTAYIAGLAKAIEITTENDVVLMRSLQKYLMEEIEKIGGFRVNGPVDLSRRICNNVNISSSSFEGEYLLNELSKVGICVSTGSACSSKSTKVSPVLQAIKCPAEYIHGNIRISLSRYNTKEEIDFLLDNLKRITNVESGLLLNKVEI